MNLDFTNFHEFFRYTVLTEKTNIWLCDIFFSVLTKFLEFWPWVTKKAYAQGKKKTRQIVVVSHLQICPRPLQQFTFRSSVELLSVRVLLLLHCNCWTVFKYTKVVTSRLIQFWFDWFRNCQLTYQQIVFQNLFPAPKSTIRSF